MYFNEIDGFCCQWLENIWPGATVDEKDIRDVHPRDLDGHSRVHFFAGIGGWEYALGLAGWPEDRLVWTGSCPCQPWSKAGKRKGKQDRRHLWPDWFGLIDWLRPPVVLGEQVADAGGRKWLAGVRADMESVGYRFGAANLCAAGVGSPHRRQRIYWGAALPMGDTDGQGLEGRRRGPGCQPQQVDPWTSGSAVIRCADGKSRRIESGSFPLAHGVPQRVGRIRAYGNAIVPQVAATFIRAFLEACS